jgi:hypothetical protein
VRVAALLLLAPCGLAACGLAACGGSAASGAAATPAGQPAPPQPRMPQDQLVATMLARLGEAAACGGGSGKKRVWCVASDGWGRGTAAALPAGALLGVSVALRADVPVADLLAGEASLSALAIRSEGGAAFGLVTDIPAKNAAGQRLVASAMAEVAKAVRGEAARARVGRDIAGYARTLPPSAPYPLARSESEWRMSGKVSEARLRKVGDAWVVVEIPKATDGPEGIFVSIYTDRWGE